MVNNHVLYKSLFLARAKGRFHGSNELEPELLRYILLMEFYDLFTASVCKEM